MRKWKHLLLGGMVGVAIGITVSVLVIGGWQLGDRSGVRNAWNAAAIRAAEPPSFDVEGSDNHLVLRYKLINSTSQDYELASYDQIRMVMMRVEDGSLVGPWKALVKFNFPIFIPPMQRTNVHITLPGLVLENRGESEAEDAYHERMRQLLESKFSFVKELIIYDDARHYQINLPRWLAKKPQ